MGQEERNADYRYKIVTRKLKFSEIFSLCALRHAGIEVSDDFNARRYISLYRYRHMNCSCNYSSFYHFTFINFLFYVVHIYIYLNYYKLSFIINYYLYYYY